MPEPAQKSSKHMADAYREVHGGRCPFCGATGSQPTELVKKQIKCGDCGKIWNDSYEQHEVQEGFEVTIPKLTENVLAGEPEPPRTFKQFQNFIAWHNEHEGTKFEVGGAYGFTELWGNGTRLEAGSPIECYRAWIKYRFDPKHNGNVHTEHGITYSHDPVDEPEWYKFKYTWHHLPTKESGTREIWIHSIPLGTALSDFRDLLDYWNRHADWKYKSLNESWALDNPRPSLRVSKDAFSQGVDDFSFITDADTDFTDDDEQDEDTDENEEMKPKKVKKSNRHEIEEASDEKETDEDDMKKILTDENESADDEEPVHESIVLEFTGINMKKTAPKRTMTEAEVPMEGPLTPKGFKYSADQGKGGEVKSITAHVSGGLKKRFTEKLNEFLHIKDKRDEWKAKYDELEPEIRALFEETHVGIGEHTLYIQVEGAMATLGKVKQPDAAPELVKEDYVAVITELERVLPQYAGKIEELLQKQLEIAAAALKANPKTPTPRLSVAPFKESKNRGSQSLIFESILGRIESWLHGFVQWAKGWNRRFLSLEQNLERINDYAAQTSARGFDVPPVAHYYYGESKKRKGTPLMEKRLLGKEVVVVGKERASLYESDASKHTEILTEMKRLAGMLKEETNNTEE